MAHMHYCPNHEERWSCTDSGQCIYPEELDCPACVGYTIGLDEFDCLRCGEPVQVEDHPGATVDCDCGATYIREHTGDVVASKAKE